MANFSWPIPQTTLTASGYSVNLNVDRELYLTVANLGLPYGGGNIPITASWQDSSGAGQTATIIPGSSFGPAPILVRTLQITGFVDAVPAGIGAQIIGVLSSSPVNPESLLARAVYVNNTLLTDVGQGLQTKGNSTIYYGGTEIDPRNIRSLVGTDNPKPFGSNGGPLAQDSSNNLQHVPVLRGTSTPIHTKALQYDSNNYPLHTLGNVLAGGNGGDTVLPASTSLTTLTADFTGNITSSKVPSGYKWLIDAAGIGVNGGGTTVNSASLQFYMPGNLFGGTGSTNTWFFTAFTDSTARSPTTSNQYGFYWFLPNWPTSVSTPNLGGEGSGIEWNVAYYWSNTGPATGDTTYLTKQLVLYPGSTPTININATVPSGDSLSVWLFLLGEQVPL